MKGVFTQFVMVIVSIGIIFTYVKPSFAKIGVIQEESKTYEAELEKVVAVNSTLSLLKSQMDSIAMADRMKLLTYMPDSVDEIAVLRDLFLIVNQSGALYRNVSSGGSGSAGTKNKNSSAVTATGPEQYGFTLEVEGTYDQLKSLFSLLERNEYPLEIQNVSFSKTEGGFLTASIELATYSFKSQLTSE